MKKLKYVFFSVVAIILLQSCTEAGTLESVDRGNNEKIEVLKYWYEDGNYVYIARFKDSPNVVTTNWDESNGKTTTRRSSVIVYENDSVQVVLKK